MFPVALRRERSRTLDPLPDNDDRRLTTLQKPDEAEAEAVRRFRNLALLLVVIAALLAVALCVAFRVRVDPSGSSMVELGLAALLVLSMMWRIQPRMERIAHALGTVGVASVGGLCCGAFAMLELRLGFPMADGWLRRADLALHMDAIQVLAMIGRHRDALIQLLAPVYNNTLELFFGSLIVLSLLGHRVEAWRGALCFVGTLLTTCSIAAFMPATGLINWAPPDLLVHLPQAFVAHFTEFYYGADPVLRLQVIDGTISFPSFHAVVGFLIFSMWRQWMVTRVAAATWLAVELLSTVAGGHYIVDLFGGFAVWAGWFALSRRIERSSGASEKIADRRSAAAYPTAAEATVPST